MRDTITRTLRFGILFPCMGGSKAAEGHRTPGRKRCFRRGTHAGVLECASFVALFIVSR